MHIFLTCTDGYKQYLKLSGGTIGVGACTTIRQWKIYNIDDDTPLLHFLSGTAHFESADRVTHSGTKMICSPQMKQTRKRVMTVCTLW